MKKATFKEIVIRSLEQYHSSKLTLKEISENYNIDLDFLIEISSNSNNKIITNLQNFINGANLNLYTVKKDHIIITHKQNSIGNYTLKRIIEPRCSMIVYKDKTHSKVIPLNQEIPNNHIRRFLKDDFLEYARKKNLL